MDVAYLLIDPGTATAEDIAELFHEMSVLYQMMGGSGIKFTVEEARETEEGRTIVKMAMRPLESA